MEGLSKHAGPAWLVSPDLRTITPNPAAQAYIVAHAGELGPGRTHARPQQLAAAYEQTLLATLRRVGLSDRTATGTAARPAPPQRLTCSVDGRPIDLLFLEIRGPRAAEESGIADRHPEQTVAYLLVA